MIKINLKELLEARKMSRYRLNQETNIGVRRINAFYFNRVKEIKTSELDLLCDVLDCDINDLIKYQK